MAKPALQIVYDGECPFCHSYVRLLRLKEGYDVQLIDARVERQKSSAYGLDLNQGMVVELDGRVYHGADAISLLSQLSRRPGPLANRQVARLVYPWLRRGRRLVLRLLGRSPL